MNQRPCASGSTRNSHRVPGRDDFPAEAQRQAARDVTAAAAVGALTVHISARYRLAEIAQAHDHVDIGSRGRALTSPADYSPNRITGLIVSPRAESVKAVLMSSSS